MRYALPATRAGQETGGQGRRVTHLPFISKKHTYSSLLTSGELYLSGHEVNLIPI